jgi:hypothetical protein
VKWLPESYIYGEHAKTKYTSSQYDCLSPTVCSRLLVRKAP